MTETESYILANGEEQSGVESNRRLRSRITHQEMMREFCGNMAITLTDFCNASPALLLHDLTAPIISHWAENYQPFFRPSMSLHAAAGTHPQEYPLTLHRNGGVRFRDIEQGSITERALTDSVCDQDFMFEQPMDAVIADTQDNFGARFLPGWLPYRLPNPDRSTQRWATGVGVYVASPLDNLNYRPNLNPRPRTYPPKELRPIIVDLTTGYVRGIIPFLQIAYRIPLNRDGAMIKLWEIFGSQWPRDKREREADKRWPGSGVSRWGRVMGKLPYGDEESYYELDDCTKALAQPNAFTEGYFASDDQVFQVQEAWRVWQQAIWLWDVPEMERRSPGVIDRRDIPIEADSLSAAGEVIREIDLTTANMTEYDILDLVSRPVCIIAMAPELGVYGARRMGLFKHYPNLAHISDEQWEEIEYNLAPCTADLSGSPEDLYWRAVHSHPDRYMRPGDNCGFTLPDDFRHGWVTFSEGVQKYGDVPDYSRRLPPPQFMDWAFRIEP